MSNSEATVFPQFDRLKSAQKHLDEIEANYAADRSAARSELAAAARAVSEIQPPSERLAAVAWAYDNSAALKRDLAWALFGKERHEYHLRKLLAGSHRNCDRCGESALAGHQFEASGFFCARCASLVNAARLKKSNERQRQSEARSLARQKRISELKTRAGLPDAEADELAALIISQVDGPSSQLSNFLRRSLGEQ